MSDSAEAALNNLSIYGRSIVSGSDGMKACGRSDRIS